MDDKKFEQTANTILNLNNIVGATGIIGMGDIMNAFIGGMGDLMNNVLAAAVPSKKEDVDDAIKKITASSPNELKDEVRREVESTKKFLWPAVKKHKKEILEIFTDKLCDDCNRIIDSYDFNLPKINTSLDEAGLMGYISLALAENDKLGKMFAEIIGCLDENGNAMNRFAYYLPELITNLDTGIVRTGPSEAEKAAANK